MHDVARATRHIRHLISTHLAQTLDSSLILTRIDYILQCSLAWRSIQPSAASIFRISGLHFTTLPIVTYRCGNSERQRSRAFLIRPISVVPHFDSAFCFPHLTPNCGWLRYVPGLVHSYKRVN